MSEELQVPSQKSEAEVAEQVGRITNKLIERSQAGKETVESSNTDEDYTLVHSQGLGNTKKVEVAPGREAEVHTSASVIGDEVRLNQSVDGQNRFVLVNPKEGLVSGGPKRVEETTPASAATLSELRGKLAEEQHPHDLAA